MYLQSLVEFHELAVISFRRYMTEVYGEEKTSIAQGKPQANNLVTSLIRSASQPVLEDERGDDSSRESTGLTKNEVYANLLVFNSAGHDTTAGTPAFDVVLLSTKPLVQDWLHEQLISVLGSHPAENYSYNDIFPKLKRCLAVFVGSYRDASVIQDKF